MNRLLLGVALFCAGLAALGQTAPKSRVIGEITALDAETGKVTVKADDGSAAAVQLAADTKLVRVPPGEKDLAKATPITVKDLAVGDRVLVQGSAPATRVIVMTKADLAQKHAADRAEWQKRGITGTVTATAAEKKEITVSVMVGGARKDVVVDAGGQVNFRRYAPGSVRFADARPSTLAELQKGDQLRALGEKNADATRLKAEEIVFGTFQTIAGKVSNVNAAAGEITITDLDTKKPVVVLVNSDTAAKTIPAQLATMLAMRLRGEQPQRPGGAPGAGRGNMDFSDMLERMPAFNIADLKKGDAIILSSTRGADPSKVAAITVVAGVEPLLTAAPERQIGGMLNFDIGLPSM